jgi:hypothetical protein
MPPISIIHGGGMLNQGRKVLMKKKNGNNCSLIRKEIEKMIGKEQGGFYP